MRLTVTNFDEFEADLINQAYDGVKAKIPAAKQALQRNAPVLTGGTRDGSFVYLSDDSNNDRAIVRFVSDPGNNTGRRRRSRGGDKANWSNARGRSRDWWGRAVDDACAIFDSEL